MTSLSLLAGDTLRKIPRRDPNQYVNELDEYGDSQIAGLHRYAASGDALRDTSTQANRAEEADRARTQALAGVDNIEGQLGRRQRALGLNLSDRQRAAQERGIGLTRAIARAGGVTAANRTSADLAQAANRAGAGLGEELEEIASAGLTQLANAEGQRNQRLAAERARKKASRNALFGQAAGAALAFI